MKQLTACVLLILLISCTNQNSPGNNGTVYLRTVFWNNSYGGSLEISWLYLGNDGTIINNPKHGLDPVDPEAEKKDNPDNIGSYKNENNKLAITWFNGKTEEWTVEKSKGEVVAINGGIVSVPEKFAPGSHIKGQFAAAAFSSSFSNVQTMVFKDDGSFALTSSTAVMTDDFSNYGENTRKGKYELNGNTLHLNFDDGQKQVANIAHWKQDDGKLELVINNNSFPQEK